MACNNVQEQKLLDEIDQLRQRNAEHEQFRQQHRDCDQMGVENQRLRQQVETLEKERDAIADIFSIGSKARSHNVIMTNLGNAKRRSDCLSLIETYLSDEDGDSKLNWGESPEKYIETFKTATQALQEENERLRIEKADAYQEGYGQGCSDSCP